MFVAHFGWLLAAFAAAGAVGRLIGGWLARRDDGQLERHRRDADICARADLQHAAILAGDEVVGMYGDYPTVRMSVANRVHDQ